jgi:hypothetical protein
MRQVWIPLSIKCESESAANMQADLIKRSSKTKDVVIEGCKVKYKQLTWQDGCDKEDLDD